MTTVDELIEPERTAVWLSSEEIGLLRAGLAAHSIAVAQESVKHGSTQDDIATARRQSDQCRVLSIALGAAQITLGG